ncbi:hypothetical protein, partial [Vibrio agarivorans]|uniref:hypothetical protein n=1 Tax=Vibrio agarivorans TaxID=153622 RepID=UPI0035E9CD4B
NSQPLYLTIWLWLLDIGECRTSQLNSGLPTGLLGRMRTHKAGEQPQMGVENYHRLGVCPRIKVAIIHKCELKTTIAWAYAHA